MPLRREFLQDGGVGGRTCFGPLDHREPLLLEQDFSELRSRVQVELHPGDLGLALGVIYDVQRRSYRTYFEADVDKLLVDLLTADRVVGFNIDRFDLPVLAGYTEADLTRISTLDMLSEVNRVLGYRLSLAHLSEANLGESKSGEGLQSLVWWKQGRIDLIEQYCRKDVELTWRLFERGLAQGHLLYRDKEERMLRVPVSW